MGALSSVNLILHAHLPYVRHLEYPKFLEEDWLFESLAESYIPLVRMLEDLDARGVDFRLSICFSPTLCTMLMDEPFGALDAQTRYSMEDEIIKIWEKNKRTIVFVTNNVEEALYLGDRIMLLASRPSYVKKEYIVDLPRPRSYTDKAFLEMRNEIVANTDLDI